MALSVYEIASLIRDLKSLNSESWPPVVVEFELSIIPGGNVNIAPSREIQSKLQDDAIDAEAKILFLKESDVQDKTEISVPWEQFEKAVARGRSEKCLYITFDENRITCDRYAIERIRFESERKALIVELFEVDCADIFL